MFQPNIHQVVIVDFNNQNKRIHTSTTVTNAINGNDGAINLVPSGGTQPLSFSWTGPNNYTSTAEDINNLSYSQRHH